MLNTRVFALASLLLPALATSNTPTASAPAPATTPAPLMRTATLRRPTPHPAPIVTILTPGQLITANPAEIEVSIKLCMPYGGVYWYLKEFKLGSTDITSNFTQSGGGQDGTCEGYEVWTGTVELDESPEVQTLYARVLDYDDYQGDDSEDFAVPARGRGVLVSSAAGFVSVPTGSRSADFTIWNTGEVGTTYSVTASCVGNASAGSCSLSSSSVQIASQASEVVTVTFTVGSSPDTGLVKVLAEDQYAAPQNIADEGWTDVTVISAPSAGVVNARAFDPTARGACVTVALGRDVAMECGDLRITHALPGVATLGKARVPTLIYNSQVARPKPVIHAHVTLPSGSLPDTVEARVYVDGSIRAYKAYLGSDWVSGGNTRRIALEADVSSYATWLPGYYVRVNLIGGANHGAVYTSSTANLPVVDRSNSPYGAGWWLAGLEELIFISSYQILWVGGDGSARPYVGGPTVFTAQNAFDRPDTITYNSGTAEYTRKGPGNLQVRFNSAGLHTATINRLGHVTTFTYVSGSRRLHSITIPVKSGSALTYTFNYDGNARLDQVIAPNSGVSRVVDLCGSYQKTCIAGPGPDTVHFGYGSGSHIYRIQSRTDRRGKVTSFFYSSVNTLDSVSQDLGSSQYITHGLKPVEGKALATAIPLDSAHTAINGPRTDVADVTTIWVNAFGAPTRIRNAEGRETALKYSTTWPGLVAETRSPSRLLTRAFYSSSTALLDSTIVYRPYNTSSHAKTSYTWDAAWRSPTSITPPAGPATTIWYNASTGNRDSSQVGSSSNRRVRYTYDGTGLLTSIDPPLVPATTITYNALGNDSTVTSPKGYTSWTLQNAIGQDTLLASPFSDTTSTYLGYNYVVPSGATNGTRVAKRYNIMGRDSVVTTYGPSAPKYPSGSSPADSLRIEHLYNAEGDVTSTKRKYSVNSNAWTLEHTYTYDGAGRVTYTTSPNSQTTNAYDPAGNVTSTTSGRGETVTMTYDALNRLKKRIVPQVVYSDEGCPTGLFYPLSCSYTFPEVCFEPDTSKFEYDASGNMARADNRYAKVGRTYYPNGQLATDKLQIRTWHEPGNTVCGSAVSGAISGGSEWTIHDYGTVHTYDLAGRRTQLDGPYYITGCNQSPCRTTYTYGGGAGELTAVNDGLGNGGSGRTTTFTYDDASRLDYITFANSVVDDREYDYDSRVVRRTVTGLVSDTLSYDAAGRVVQARLGGVTTGTINTWYGAMGAVTGATGLTLSATGQLTSETFVTDAIGNRWETEQLNIKPSTHPDPDGTRNYTYNSGGALTGVAWPGNSGQSGYYYDKSISYDGSGNVDVTLVKEQDSQSITNIWDASHNYYDAADKLRRFIRKIGPYANDETHPGQRNADESYRYDALGRRVATMMFRSSNCSGSTDCLSYVERTVWDGDQVLFEIRAPADQGISAMETDYTYYTGSNADGYGQVAYVHAGGIDQPIVAMRTGYGDNNPVTVYPHANWRGVFELGSANNGTQFQNPTIQWLGRANTVDHAVGNPSDGWMWFGNLIPGKTDGSGMQYMRNRYYDPSTGKFTQEDPIGLAGGMNLYGYAGGDPVNFLDPMGLFPLPLVIGAAWALYEIGSAAYDSYQAYKTVRDPNASAMQKSAMVAAATASVFGPGGGGTLVIGKMDDLARGVGAGERTLLPRMADDLGSPAANWKRNAGLMREEMAKGNPIRDASVNAKGELTNNTGFLRAERQLLQDRGWTYDQGSRMWNPPRQ